MSDYLVNLARRSVGLAPMVRARVAPPAPPIDATTQMAPESIAERATPATNHDAAAAPVPTIAATVASASSVMPSVPVAPIAMVNPSSPMMQRAPITAAMPTVAPVAPTVQSLRPTDDASVGRNALTRIDGARDDSPRPPAPTLAAENAVVTRLVEHVVETGSHVITPAATVRVEPRVEMRPAADKPGVKVDAPQPALREALPTGSESTDVVAIMVEPAPRADVYAPPPAPRVDGPSAPERTVHVRIGAIEIHGAASAFIPQAALPAAPSAVDAAASSTASSGFDDFTALRSYAPWAW